MSTPTVRAALAELLQLTEPLLKKFVFTAERAGEVAALVSRCHTLLAEPAVPVQPLTDEQIEDVMKEANRLFQENAKKPCDWALSNWTRWFVRSIERAHNIGGSNG